MQPAANLGSSPSTHHLAIAMIRSSSKNTTPLDVKKHDERQALKRSVVDPKTGQINYGHLKQLLDYYKDKGTKVVYLKKNVFGQTKLSFTEPGPLGNKYKDMERLAKAFDKDFSEFFGKEYGNEVLKAKAAIWNNRDDNVSRNRHHKGHTNTSVVREAVDTLFEAKANGPKKAEAQKPVIAPTHEPLAIEAPERAEAQREESPADAIVTQYQNKRKALLADKEANLDVFKARYTNYDQHSEFAKRMNGFVLFHGDAFADFCSGKGGQMNDYIHEQYPDADASVQECLKGLFDDTPLLGLMQDVPANRLITAYAKLGQ